ncbi:MAG TPA: hypothetical protein VKB09_03675, partial [Thermomicrobiales bacterium]|nr:hypothetical protein [Thermomicrobiales bacterium]
MSVGSMEGNELEQLVAGIPGLRADRRSLLRCAAGIGLALPALGAFAAGQGRAVVAQDQPAAPTAVQPFAVRDPYLAAVEAGQKDITVTAKDATLYVAKDVA